MAHDGYKPLLWCKSTGLITLLSETNSLLLFQSPGRLQIWTVKLSCGSWNSILQRCTVPWMCGSTSVIGTVCRREVCFMSRLFTPRERATLYREPELSWLGVTSARTKIKIIISDDLSEFRLSRGTRLRTKALDRSWFYLYFLRGGGGQQPKSHPQQQTQEMNIHPDSNPRSRQSRDVRPMP